MFNLQMVSTQWSSFTVLKLGGCQDLQANLKAFQISCQVRRWCNKQYASFKSSPSYTAKQTIQHIASYNANVYIYYSLE